MILFEVVAEANEATIEKVEVKGIGFASPKNNIPLGINFSIGVRLVVESQGCVAKATKLQSKAKMLMDKNFKVCSS